MVPVVLARPDALDRLPVEIRTDLEKVIGPRRDD
jgi:hypothetical protein